MISVGGLRAGSGWFSTGGESCRTCGCDGGISLVQWKGGYREDIKRNIFAYLHMWTSKTSVFTVVLGVRLTEDQSSVVRSLFIYGVYHDTRRHATELEVISKRHARRRVPGVRHRLFRSFNPRRRSPDRPIRIVAFWPSVCSK